MLAHRPARPFDRHRPLRSPRQLAVGAALVGALLVGACGDDGDGDSTADGGAEPTTATSAPTDDPTGTTTTAAGSGALAPDAPTQAIAVPGDQVFPEGVAYDEGSGTFFVSSSDDGTIYRSELGATEAEEYLPAGADGRTAALGMAVDAERRRLWIAGGTSQTVFAYDLDTDELLAALPVPDGSGASLVNDVTVTDDGDAYVTNSGLPVLYRASIADDGTADLEVWLDHTDTPIPTDTGILLNGIVPTGDGHLLAVHTATQKLYRIDLATKEIVVVDTGGEPVGGDGLAIDSTTVFGVSPTSVIRTELADDFASGQVVGETTDPAFAFATTVALVPEERMLVVNAQFTAREDPVLPFTVLDLPRTPAG